MIYSALSLKINAKITILFHINDFFVFIFKKVRKNLVVLNKSRTFVVINFIT